MHLIFYNSRTLLFLFLLLCFQNNLISQSAWVQFQIIDDTNGALTPARLTVLKDGKAIDLKVESKLNIASRKNTVYTSSGTGAFLIEPGQYEFWFSKGMEYSIDRQELNVQANEKYFLSARLQKAINTDGFVGGDMHLHTVTNSGHGDANLIERVISCAAEGLDWAVATDHNFITDYKPYLDSAGLSGVMQTSVSNEVSTSIGHFNTYPLKADSKAIDSKPTDGNVLFKNIRSKAGDEVVIQVNHPRWIVSDYFNTKGLDPYFGTISNKEWSWDFDAIEVLNENYRLGWMIAPGSLQSVKRDWFNLLNQNIRITGIGNSDSHSVIKQIAGIPRNYIQSSTDIPIEIDEQELAKNIKSQRVSVACGLYTSALVDGKNAMGETFNVINKPLDLQLKIQAADWVDCTRAELIRNGAVVQTFDLKNKKPNGVIRLDTTMQLQPERDSWYLLIAYGDRPMFPIVGEADKPVYPLGFTNPVWVKTNTATAFTSVFEQADLATKQKKESTENLLALMESEPGMMPALFYHLFSGRHKNALAVAEGFFAKAGPQQKHILFRELAKTDLAGAQGLLEQFQKEDNIPLEEVLLASYIHFPIRESKVNQFKKKKKSAVLDEQLGYLETQLRYIQSGAVQQKVKTSFSPDDKVPLNWKETAADKNAQFHFSKKEGGSYFLKTKWRMLKDTTLVFYVSTNQEIQVWINGRKAKSILPNTGKSIEDKIINLSLSKRGNEVTLQINATEDTRLSFHQASEKMLIDPTLKLEEVNHMAVNAAVNYLNEYNFKYHGHGIALTDGYRGGESYANQLWQGWFGEPAEFVVDLGASVIVKEISLGILTNQKSWIFQPENIEFMTSVDGKEFTSVFTVTFDASKKMDGTKLETVKGKIKPQKIRYIKVVATPIEKLPDWHLAKGEKAWIFLDEVMVR